MSGYFALFDISQGDNRGTHLHELNDFEGR